MSNERGYTYRNHGINNQGNHYCSRDYGPSAPNQNPYHYSNSDGSYYYSNPDGSRYYNDGRGGSVYAPPGCGYAEWKSAGDGDVSRDRVAGASESTVKNEMQQAAIRTEEGIGGDAYQPYGYGVGASVYGPGRPAQYQPDQYGGNYPAGIGAGFDQQYGSAGNQRAAQYGIKSNEPWDYSPIEYGPGGDAAGNMNELYGCSSYIQEANEYGVNEYEVGFDQRDDVYGAGECGGDGYRDEGYRGDRYGNDGHRGDGCW